MRKEKTFTKLEAGYAARRLQQGARIEYIDGEFFEVTFEKPIRLIEKKFLNGAKDRARSLRGLLK